MQRIDTYGSLIEVGSIVESDFGILLDNYAKKKIVIITDENTHKHCVMYLIGSFDQLSKIEILVLPAGEESKQLSIAENVWVALTDYGISRHDLIINVGGGMITDMGGFIATCYKRGCSFVNIPTSLIGMIDASIGGKTGVNLGEYKNQIGCFSFPEATFIDPGFLETLPEEHCFSGFAEMIKHGLIADKKLFKDVVGFIGGFDETREISEDLIVRSLNIKNDIVKLDPFEKNLRKKLNFGHTIGHAVEGYLNTQLQITHGHAIAIGMIIESFISYKKGLIGKKDFEKIEGALFFHYDYPDLDDKDIKHIIELLSNDKKNQEDKILCVLLTGIGDCIIDQELKEEEVIEAFMHFKNKQINLN